MVAIGEFSRVVSGFYGAALAPDGWPTAMAEVRSVFGGLTAGLIQIEGSNRMIRYAQLSPEAAQTYTQYYHSVDYVLDSVQRGPVGLIRSGRPLIAAQPRSEFDSDWLRPNEFTDGLFVRLSGGRDTTCFLVAGPPTDGGFDTAERIMVLNALIPHLQQALRTEKSLREQSIGHGELSMAIESNRQGIVLVGPNSVVKQMNSAADRILRRGDGLSVRNGSVEPADPITGRRLARSIDAALGVSGTTIRSGDSVLCPRPSGLRPYVIHVVPSDRELPASALMVIVDPAQLPEPSADLLRRLYGLTHAEVEVATCLMRGAGLKAIADEISVSLATVKTHLQHVFDKTDTHRQAELVRLLLSITG